MADKVKKHFNIKIEEKANDKREVTVIGSQLGVDRDKDIVDIKSMNINAYKANPVVLWSHRSGEPPIGKAIQVTKASGNTQLKFKIQFATAEEYPFADTIYRLVKGNYINASSIGFAVDYQKSEYDKERGGYNLNNAELLEISLCNVPANADALITQRSFQKALDDKVINEKELEEFQSKLDIKEDEENTEHDNIKDSEQTINDLLQAIQNITLSLDELKIEIKNLKNVQEKTPETYIDVLFDEIADELDQESISSSETSLDIDDSELDDLLNDLTNNNED